MTGGGTVAVRFQLVIDCANPDLLARFWAAALGYELEAPPDGFASWDDYWRDMGLPDEDLGIGEDRIVDPGGGGPRIWFQVVPERKTIKNRIHLDIHASGGRGAPLSTRRELVDAEVQRLTELRGQRRPGAAGGRPRSLRRRDDRPEGNEFDVN